MKKLAVNIYIRVLGAVLVLNGEGHSHSHSRSHIVHDCACVYKMKYWHIEVDMNKNINIINNNKRLLIGRYYISTHTQQNVHGKDLSEVRTRTTYRYSNGSEREWIILLSYKILAPIALWKYVAQCSWYCCYCCFCCCRCYCWSCYCVPCTP